MEKLTKFVFDRLENIIRLIPSVKILYKYNLSTESHLIKVLPADVYKNNPYYKELEIDLILDFIDKFPYESLVFMTEGDWINIDKPDKEFTGDKYISNPISIESDFFIKSGCFENIEIFENVFFENELSDSKSNKVTLNSKDISKPTGFKGINVLISGEVCSEDDNFALAA